MCFFSVERLKMSFLPRMYFILLLIALSQVNIAQGSLSTSNDTTERNSVDDVGKVIWHSFAEMFVEDISVVNNCSKDPTADFPNDLFTEWQLKHGAIVLHFLGGIYCFTFLAVICNDYFLPAVECICEDLNISRDVAAATFMATATSCPELFVNIMSTFIINSDLGIGTIVGSAMFNTLGVTAIGGLSAIHPIVIKRWPVTRDSIIYIINITILVGITWDGTIKWYEAFILMMLYVAYFVFMFNNKRIIKFFIRFFKRKTGTGGFNVEKTEEGKDNDGYEDIDIPKYTPARVSVMMSMHYNGGNSASKRISEKGELGTDAEAEPEKIRKSLWRYPVEKPLGLRMWFIYSWPLKLILTCTVPSPKTYRMLYPLTFVMCILCIAANSYFISWMISVIGATIGIPDTIMGMTFLAFGGCLPEACSIFIMSRRGEGGMGISNSLGANSLNILFSLGIPWFIKSIILINEGEDRFIEIESGGIEYIIMSLILAVGLLYLVLFLRKFTLKKITGATIFVLYIVFIVIAILMESGVFFDVGLSKC